MLISLLICLVLLSGLSGLVFLQNYSSIYIRSLGLLTIFLAILGYYVYIDFAFTSAPYIIGLAAVLAAIGFFSDFYSATLRTWFFRISPGSMQMAIYGIMFGILLFPLLGFNLINGLLLGTIIGILIGEIRSPGKKSFSRIAKSTLGAVVGIFGMATKTIVGIQMIDLFLTYSGIGLPIQKAVTSTFSF